ncbi:MAG: hypothetical protein V4501_01740 [Pseudomonadota bacterium]
MPTPEPIQLEMTIDHVENFYQIFITFANKENSATAAIAKKILDNYLQYLNHVLGLISCDKAWAPHKKLLISSINYLIKSEAYEENNLLINNICRDIEADGALLESKFDMTEAPAFINRLKDVRTQVQNNTPHQLLATTSSTYYPPILSHLVYIHKSSQKSVDKLMDSANYFIREKNWQIVITLYANAKAVLEASKSEDFDNPDYYFKKIHQELASAYHCYGRELFYQRSTECEAYYQLAIETSEDIEPDHFFNTWIEAHNSLAEFKKCYAETLFMSDLKKTVELLESSMLLMIKIITRYPNTREQILFQFEPNVRYLIYIYTEYFNRCTDLSERINLSYKLIYLFASTPANSNKAFDQAQIHMNFQFITVNMMSHLIANPNQAPELMMDSIFEAMALNSNHNLYYYNNKLEIFYLKLFLHKLTDALNLIYMKYDILKMANFIEKFEPMIVKLKAESTDEELNGYYNALRKNMACYLHILIIDNLSFRNAVYVYRLLINLCNKIDPVTLSPQEEATFQLFHQLYAANGLETLLFSAKPGTKNNIKLAKIFITKNLKAKFIAPDQNFTFRIWQSKVADQIYNYAMKLPQPNSYPITLEFLEYARNTLAIVPIAYRTYDICNNLEVYNKTYDYVAIEIRINEKISSKTFRKAYESLEQLQDDLSNAKYTRSYPLDTWYNFAIDVKVDKMYQYASDKCDALIKSISKKILRRPYFFSNVNERQKDNNVLRSLFYNHIAPLQHNKTREMLKEALEGLDCYLSDSVYTPIREIPLIVKIIKHILLTDADYVYKLPAPRTRSYSI